MKSKEYLKEIRGLNKDDLKARAVAVAEELMRLRFKKASGQLQQSHRVKELRKSLAQINTVLNAQAK